MKVTVVTKPGCPRCLLLKQKLKLMGVEWDEAGPKEIEVRGMQYPVTIIDGALYEYAAAIKTLKGMLDEADDRTG